MESKRPGKQISHERLAKFLEAYIASGYNAVEAGVRIGMSRKSAIGNAHRYTRAIRNRLDFKAALAALGLTPAVQLAKLKRLEKAKIPRFNPHLKTWEAFEAGNVQLEATKEINRIMGAYPAEKPATEPVTIQLVVDVRV